MAIEAEDEQGLEIEREIEAEATTSPTYRRRSVVPSTQRHTDTQINEINGMFRTIDASLAAMQQTQVEIDRLRTETRQLLDQLEAA